MRHEGSPIILVTRKLEQGWADRIAAAAPESTLAGESDLAADPGLIERVEICYPSLRPELWARARSLRWLQADFAGLDSLLGVPEAAGHPAVLTNVHIHGQCIAEHLWGMALMLTRNLHQAVLRQARGTWDTPPLREGISSLEGKTLCVVGLGVIGTRLAGIGRAFGMKVIGISRHARPNAAVDEMVGPSERVSAFALSRIIMMVLPGTPDTVRFVGKQELDSMKGAFLLNGGRGGSIDTSELIAALKDGRVRGAGLDVTDPEPLPDGHPLWSLPNVVITPHYAGVHPGYNEEAFDVFCRNLERWVQGRPLEYVVDRSAGY
jgi:phosphoglycerate dehydrogenase-like enzyme